MLPPVKWTDTERQHGAVSFEQHLHQLMANHTTTTTTPPPLTTPTSPVEKVQHAVVNLLPHITEAIEEILTPSIPVDQPGSTTPRLGSGVPTGPTLPPPCKPEELPHVSILTVLSTKFLLAIVWINVYQLIGDTNSSGFCGIGSYALLIFGCSSLAMEGAETKMSCWLVSLVLIVF
jgi:hypothetical protein